MHATHRRRLTPLTAALALMLLAPAGSALAAPQGGDTDGRIVLARHERGGHRDGKYEKKHRRGGRRDRYDRRHRHDRRDRYDRHDRHHRHDRHYRQHGRYRHYGQYRPYGRYRDGRHHRHFTIPRVIRQHHRYRDYYYGRTYYRDHHHHHRIYRFPVYVGGYLEYRPYAYCEGEYFATGYFGIDGPHFSLRIGF